MSRIFSFMAKDARVALRENLATYMLFGPIVLVLLTRLTLPFFTEPSPRFAVAAGTDPAVVEALVRRGEVETLPDRAAVVARVNAEDDVAGFAPLDAGTEVLLEGNEPGYIQELPGFIVDQAAAKGRAAVAFAHADEGRSLGTIHAWLTAIMGYVAAVLGGTVVSLTVIDEKEGGTLAALSSSPLGFGEYLTAKALFIGLIALALGPASAAGMLWGVVPLGELRLGWLVVATVATFPTGLLMGALVGAFAEDQLSAIGLLKGLLTVFSGVPFAGLAVTGAWAMAFAPFTLHWACQAIFAAIQPDVDVLRPALYAMLTGIPAVAAAAWVMRRRLGYAAA
ncbi:MAG: ABC transporter permease subunit [Alphaproteobacteria bacterium]|nr:ABC transporter permease subunit [Alphaproteobacteria bacterium]